MICSFVISGMSASQFTPEDSSISKLMAVAMQMDGECADVGFQWGSDSTVTSSNPTKMGRDPSAYPPNVECWNMQQNNAPSFPNNYAFNTNHPGANFTPAHQKCNAIANGDHCASLNDPSMSNSSNKPLQDQFRQKYGNYSNDKYPDFNIAVKAETSDPSKWNTCAVSSSNRNSFDSQITANSIGEGNFSPKSFIEKVSSEGVNIIPHEGTPSSSTGEAALKPFECHFDSDSDSKASGTDTSSQNGHWGYSPAMDIDVNQMITSGVTVAGYKPRKIINKRKKATVPSDAKDNGYWEKRKKNNDSARRSREAKKEKERSFYKRALELEYENHCLKERVVFLEQKLEMIVQQHPNLNIGDA